MADARGMHPTAVEIQSNYTKRFDIQDTDSTKIFIGYASHGTATNVASWQIKLITLDANGVPVSLQWADSDEAFDNIWNNRTSLSYG